MMITEGRGDFYTSSLIVRELTRDAVSLLDIGCRYGAHTKDLPIPVKTFFDIIRPDNAPQPFVLGDARQLPKYFEVKSFDVITCLDMIEHIEKVEGYDLLSLMEIVAKKRIILFTPLGELWVGNDPSPYGHHSGWLPEELEERGYQVWSWPQFHEFPDGSIHGAFWAWKTVWGEEMTPQELNSRLRAS